MTKEDRQKVREAIKLLQEVLEKEQPAPQGIDEEGDGDPSGGGGGPGSDGSGGNP